MRCLGWPDHEIQAVEYDFPNNVKDQCKNAIFRWWKVNETMDDHTKLKSIIAAVKYEELGEINGK